ncbi:hypothetical protein BDV32DRAFT_133988 [Aspergillus pseudonomiae]|nr:hypothetical protein BDV32DRAFT_133988 [Aspergillus pseudonomiae]
MVRVLQFLGLEHSSSIPSSLKPARHSESNSHCSSTLSILSTLAAMLMGNIITSTSLLFLCRNTCILHYSRRVS